MSLAEALKATGSVYPTRCHVALLLTDPDLPAADMRVIRDAINNPRIPGEHIARQLQNHGLRLSGDSIRRHRKKACRCE